MKITIEFEKDDLVNAPIKGATIQQKRIVGFSQEYFTPTELIHLLEKVGKSTCAVKIIPYTEGD